MKRFISIVLTVFSCVSVFAGIGDLVDDVAKRNPFNSGVWGIKAVTSSGEVLADYNSAVRMLPASNVKLLSTALVLDKFGPDYRFKTALSSPAEIEDGVLKGDLYIVGSGDPSLGLNGPVTTIFSQWKNILSSKGISKVDGRIIADHRYLGIFPANEYWQVGDVRCGDGLELRGLNFRRNVRDPEHIFTRSFVGVPSPVDSCAQAFRNYLLENGIKVTGGTASDSAEGTVPSDSLHKIGETSSEKLSELVKHTNYTSDNFYAEAFMNAVRRGKSVKDTFKEAGFDFSGCDLTDGCGLSRQDFVTPAFFCDFLMGMATRPYFNTYLKSLPQPGSGTLAARLPDTDKSVKQRIYMKSGSLNGVSCFSGYILPSDEGKEIIVFSILTNNMQGNGKTVRVAIDQMIEALAKEN